MIMFIIWLITVLAMINPPEEAPIIDSNMTFEQAIAGTKAPDSVIKQLCLLDVEYYSTDDKLHRGQIVINKAVRDDIEAIFKMIKEHRFIIAKAIPIVKYKWSDDASMADNNTSAFCYRNIAGKQRLSNHSFGRAIDINPFWNPVVYPDGKVSPKGGKYKPGSVGTLEEGSVIVNEFKKRGWRWGRTFSSYADNHHFDKIE